MPYFQEVFFLEFIFKLKQNHTPFFLHFISQASPGYPPSSTSWVPPTLNFLYYGCIHFYMCVHVYCYGYMHANTISEVVFVCVFMVLGLTTLHWATREGAHLWKRLCLLPEVISCLQSLTRGEIINSILRGIGTGRTF